MSSVQDVSCIEFDCVDNEDWNLALCSAGLRCGSICNWTEQSLAGVVLIRRCNEGYVARGYWKLVASCGG